MNDRITKFLYLIFIFVIFSCSKDDEVKNVDMTYDYFPVKVGSEWIYSVDSFAYDDNTGVTTIDTFAYQYKEVIAELLNGNTESNYAEFLVKRFYKYADTADWISANSNRVIKTNEKLERIDENVHYIRLLFPLALDKIWNGNMTNAKGEEQYKIVTFDEPFRNYPQTCRIEQYREENMIEEIVREETYARKNGLVYILSDSLNTQTKNGKVVTRGFRLRVNLVSYKQ